MTVPLSRSPEEEEEDDEMPPLEYIGAPAPPSKAQPVPPVSGGGGEAGDEEEGEEEDDDSMPPLDYVGLAPGTAGKEPVKKLPASTAAGGVDDFDDMPPLEYVGTGAAHAYSFREGAKVRLKGLSKAELNGQTGTIMPFLNTTKDRLPVRLDSTGKSVSIKPDNLESIASAGPEVTPEPRTTDESNDDTTPPPTQRPPPSFARGAAPKVVAPEDDDDDMPPLDCVGASGVAVVAVAQPDEPVQASAAKLEEEEDDDEMPPLEHVGVAAPVQQRQHQQQPLHQQAVDDDDDEMPPLEYVGGIAPPQPQAVAAGAAEEEDEMPPLMELAGTGSSLLASSLKEGDQVVLKGLSKAELNGQRGTVMSFRSISDQDRIPVKLESSGKRVSIKPEHVERLLGNVDTDTMATVPRQEQKPKKQPADVDDDDEMPPLENVGAVAPPLQQIPSKPQASHIADEYDDDDMPPLEHVGAGISLDQHIAGKLEDDDDDMPPLEYIGTSSSAPSQPKEPAKPQSPDSDGDDDDDMPPLEYVGVATPAEVRPAASKPLERTRELQAVEASDDDDMPPLEYVGTDPSVNICFREGDRVVLKGLSKAELNGQHGTILSFADAAKDRLPVRLEASQQRVAIKPENLERLPAAASSLPTQALAASQAAVADDDDDDEMPPLEHTSQAKPPQAANAPVAITRPSISCTPAASTLSAAPSFKEGDKVILRGLRKAELNGQKCTVLARALDATEDWMSVRLDGSGQKASIKAENLERLSTAESDSGDSMPPLDYLGSSPAQIPPPAGPVPAPTAAAAAPADDDDDDMPPLEYMGVATRGVAQPVPTAGQSQEEVEDDDDMPPLECMGKVAGVARAPTPTAKTAMSAAASFREGDVVVLRGLSKTELNGQRGIVLAFSKTAEGGRLPVQLEATGLKVSIKPENLERTAVITAAAVSLGPAAPAEDSEDDSMPPLDYVGAGLEYSKKVEEEDDDVVVVDDDDDDMPPLEYIGAAAPQHQEQLSVAPAATQAAADEDDEDMPPLEYVGATASGSVSFKEGDCVILRGLSKAELNGRRGTVMPFLQRANGRLPVRLESGAKLSIKPENLEPVATSLAPGGSHLSAKPSPEPTTQVAEDGAASDDSMPPLDYVGTATVPGLAASGQGRAVTAELEAEDSGDSMPPLEYTGQASAPASLHEGMQCQGKFVVGDIAILRGLGTAELNGERVRVVKEPDPSEPRAQVKLLRTGKKLLVKWANMENASPAAAVAESDADDSALPLDAGPAGAGTVRPGGDGAATAARTRVQGRSPDELLELMRHAMQSTAVAPVLEALAQVESAEGIDWGELLPRKKQLLKKLRAKRRKLQPQGDESPAQPENESPSQLAAPAGQLKAAMPSHAQASGSDRSSHSEKDWVVLGAGAQPGPGAGPGGGAAARAAAGPVAAPAVTAAGAAAAAEAAGGAETPESELRAWCRELQLPAELVETLEAEEVNDPQELTGVPEEELAALTKGLKIGPRGRFMKAVRRMRAAEQAEMGSTCGSIA